MAKPKQDVISKHIIETTEKYLKKYVHENIHHEQIDGYCKNAIKYFAAESIEEVIRESQLSGLKILDELKKYIEEYIKDFSSKWKADMSTYARSYFQSFVNDQEIAQIRGRHIQVLQEMDLYIERTAVNFESLKLVLNNFIESAQENSVKINGKMNKYE